MDVEDPPSLLFRSTLEIDYDEEIGDEESEDDHQKLTHAQVDALVIAEPVWDEDLEPKQVSWHIAQKSLVFSTPSLFKFKPRNPPAPSTKVGSACTGFSVTIDGQKKKVDCIFNVKARNTSNSTLRKDGCWQKCHGCRLLQANLSDNRKVRNRGMAPSWELVDLIA